MTKEELIGLVQLNLGNAGTLHENQIHLNICLAWHQMLFAVYSKDPKQIDRFAITTKDVTIQRDEHTGAYYSLLPMTPIRFSDVAEGLRRVYKKRQMAADDYGRGDEIVFVPMPVYQTQLISHVDGGVVDNTIGYFVKDTKIWYYHIDKNIESVCVDIVPPLEDLSLDTNVVIPEGGVQMLIGITQEILSGTPYVDPRLRKINLQQI